MLNESNKHRVFAVLTEMRKSAHNRTNIDEMREIVGLLEDEQSLVCHYHDEDQYETFCKAYVIRLLEKYIRGKCNVEIMLLAYGLLRGYDQIEAIEERRKQYVRDAAGHNKAVNDKWLAASDSARKNEDKIIKKLADYLTDKTLGKGQLGLAEEVMKDLSQRFPGGLPEELPLPVPRFVKNGCPEGAPPSFTASGENAGDAVRPADPSRCPPQSQESEDGTTLQETAGDNGCGSRLRLADEEMGGRGRKPPAYSFREVADAVYSSLLRDPMLFLVRMALTYLIVMVICFLTRAFQYMSPHLDDAGTGSIPPIRAEQLEDIGGSAWDNNEAIPEPLD